MIVLRKWPQRLVAAALSLCALPASAWAQDAPAEGIAPGLDPMAQRYQLGQGLKLGDSGFALGGYSTASAGNGEHTDWRAALDSLSGFVWWDNGGRWHLFSELELEDALVADSGTVTSGQAKVELERFYVDYADSDLLKLRLGKFLTPVGRWNLIHASPLVWTTSRPLITEQTFPTNATGAMVYGVLPWTAQGVEYSIYYSPGVELARNSEIDTFTEAIGGHLTFSPFEHTQVGVSYANFEQEHTPDEQKNLYGLDFVWSRHRWELSGEVNDRIASGHDPHRNEHGAYLQGVAPLTQRLYGVVRYENFRGANGKPDLHIYLGGLNFRLRPAVVLKAEYSHATETDIDVRDGFLASLAVLF